METTTPTPPTTARTVLDPPPAGAPRGRRVLEVLLAVVVTAAALVSGMNVAAGNRTLAVLPVVAVMAVGLGLLALTRFGGFVMLILAVRPILDAVKLSAGGAGTDVGNTASNRGLDPSSIIGVLFLLAAALWLAGQIRRGRFLRGSRVQLAMGAFMAACVISVAGSSQPQASVLELLRLGTVMMMFVVVNQLVRDRRTMIHIISACYVGLIFPLLYTIYGIVAGAQVSEVKGSLTRLTGPFSQSNTFARYLMFLIVFGVAIYPYVTRRLRLALTGLLGLSVVFLLLSLTITAVVGTLAGIVILIVVQRRKGLAFGLLVALMAGAFLVPGISERLSSFDTGSVSDPQGNSLAWRFSYWTEVLPLANHNPVTGIGLDVTQYQTDAAKQPHNDIIRAYVETGVLGTLTYLAVLFSLVGVGRRATQRAPRGTLEHGVGAGAMACAVAFLLCSVAANIMSNVVVLFSIAAFAGCASYVSRTYVASSPESERERLGAPVS